MTDDLISQAEALMGRPNGYAPSLITQIVGRLVEEIKHLQADADFLHKFVDDPGSTLEAALNAVREQSDVIRKQQAAFADAIRTAAATLTKWQQIAIKQRALINFIETEERYAYSEHVILSDDEMSIAAKELGLQGYKTNGHIEINGERYVRESEQKAYVERLEEAFLDAYHAKIYYGRIYYKKDPGPREERIAETHAALEKIREDG